MRGKARQLSRSNGTYCPGERSDQEAEECLHCTYYAVCVCFVLTTCYYPKEKKSDQYVVKY